MEHAEGGATQDRQKTVVAFVAGLLIGGLLVWVFSSSPASAPADEAMHGDEMHENGDEHADHEHAHESAADGSAPSNVQVEAPAVSGASVGGAAAPNGAPGARGALVVNDQPAGMAVVLADVSFPTTDGWVVVREYAGGESGNILGAARYSTTVGLTPGEVELLRGTKAGNSYRVSFHSEDGDLVFDMHADVEMTGTAAFFTAK